MSQVASKLLAFSYSLYNFVLFNISLIAYRCIILLIFISGKWHTLGWIMSSEGGTNGWKVFMALQHRYCQWIYVYETYFPTDHSCACGDNAMKIAVKFLDWRAFVCIRTIIPSFNFTTAFAFIIWKISFIYIEWHSQMLSDKHELFNETFKSIVYVDTFKGDRVR